MQTGFLNPNGSCIWRKRELVSKRDLLQIFASWFKRQFFFFFPFLFLNSPALELKENQHSALAPALPSSRLWQGQQDTVSSPAHLHSPSAARALQRSCFERDVKEPEEILPRKKKGLRKPTAPAERGSLAERLKGRLLVLPHRQQITAHVSCGTPYHRKTFRRFTAAAHLPQSFPLNI